MSLKHRAILSLSPSFLFFFNQSLVNVAPPHNLSDMSEFSSRLQRSHGCQALRETLPQTHAAASQLLRTHAHTRPSPFRPGK